MRNLLLSFNPSTLSLLPSTKFNADTSKKNLSRWRVISLLFIMNITLLTPIISQNKDLSKYEINPQSEIITYSKNGEKFRIKDGALMVSYNLNENLTGKTIIEKAENFLLQHIHELGLEKFDISILQLESQLKIQSGTVIKYQQYYKGLKVDDNKIILKFNQEDKLSAINNSTFPIDKTFNVYNNISSDQAFILLKKHFDNVQLKTRPGQLIVHVVNGIPMLCWQFQLNLINPHSSWICYIDARQGKIIETINTTCSINGSGTVFNPSPTYSAGIPYGTGNFIDNDDATNTDLNSQMINVVLNDIEENQGVYKLKGPYAAILDPNGNFNNSTSDFSVTRDDDLFEAVMCYYYIDKSLRYLDSEMGIDLPLPYTGGLRFSPNDLAEDPGSYYYPFEVELHFGLGGIDQPDVDAAEDAFIILHELGHAVHHLISGTSGIPQGSQGMSEGLSDYWGVSETRDCSNTNFYNEWDAEYHKVFHWGAQPYINLNDFQRTTNLTATYNPNGSYEWHYGGQFLATALMRIYSDLGKFKTDLLLIETIPMLTASGTNGTTLQDAGYWLYDAAQDLNWSDNDLCIVYHHLDDVLKIGSETTFVPAPTGGNGNYYIKDTQCDSGEEINPTNEPLWASEDIWVRNEEDGILEHQNPEFKLNSPNWVYVRVRGTGCEDLDDAQLRVYFTKASTGVEWPDTWNDYYTTGPNGSVLTGDEITSTPIALPSIAPGDEYIVSFPWYPPNPANFFTDKHHFCLYARIISEDDPMFITEGSNVFYNTKNNNNIAWKNISIFDVDPGNIAGPISVFLGCNDDAQLGSIGISTPNNSLDKKIHEVGNVYIELKNPFKARWIAAGSKGDNFTVTNEGYLLVENENFVLEDIEIVDCDEYINIYFEPFDEGRFAAFDIIQYDSLKNIIGGERFEFQPDGYTDRSSHSDFYDSISHNNILVYPNPAINYLNVRMFANDENIESFFIYDIYGKLITTLVAEDIIYPADNYQIDISNFNAGVYFILAKNTEGTKVRGIKFIKI